MMDKIEQFLKEHAPSIYDWHRDKLKEAYQEGWNDALGINNKLLNL